MGSIITGSPSGGGILFNTEDTEITEDTERWG